MARVIKWQKRFEMGIPLIDGQHHFLWELTSRLQAARPQNQAMKHFFRGLILTFFVLTGVWRPCFAQDRTQIPVYMPLPTGGTQEQRTYFYDQFQMELIGANYPLAGNAAESVYILELNIQNNPEFDASLPAGNDNGRFLLDLKLLNSEDNNEIVRFSFPFTDLAPMSNWNLFLLYQAMANAYVPATYHVAIGPPPPDDSWRNQWLYLGGGLGLDMGYFLNVDTNITRGSMALPALRLGAEIHFLPFLSAELNPFRLGFIHDSKKYIAEMGFGAAIKGVFKPSDYFMLEPYAGLEYDMPFDDAQENRLAALGGLQMGLRGGKRGVITIDFSASYGILGQVSLANGLRGSFARYTLLAGYKYGFFDRNRTGQAGGQAGESTTSP